MRKMVRALIALFAAGASLAAVARTPDYPKQPIRMVVTFPPGGSADAVVRMLVPRLSEKLGQQVIVDNRPGAGGNIGLSLVAKAPAVTSPQRLPQLPDVPTASEAGLAGYDSTGWFGVVAPAGSPPAIVQRLNAEITAALNDPAIQARMRALGVEPAPTTSQAFAAYIGSETRKWGQVIRQASIRIDP